MPGSLIPQVKALLVPDYPKGTDFSWLNHLNWSGRKKVPVSKINMRTGATEWSLALHDPKKLAEEARKVKAGNADPVLLVNTPGSGKYFALNGHSRIIASQRLGRPVHAIVGKSHSVHGPWEKHRSSSHTVQLTADTATASTVPEPVGTQPLWKHKGWQLPPYIQHVANELIDQGHGESEAIAMAVGIVRDWSEGHDGHGRKVHPDVQAAAAKNIAKWEQMKAQTHTSKAVSAIELTFVVPPGGGMGAPFNPALHPRAYHGRFGSKGGLPSSQPRQPGPQPASGSSTDPEDQRLLDQAAALTHQANLLRRQARALTREAQRILHPPAASAAAKKPVSAAASAAAKKAAATRAAKGIKPFTSTKKSSAAASATVKQASMLLSNAKVLRGRARKLDQAAAVLRRRART